MKKLLFGLVVLLVIIGGAQYMFFQLLESTEPISSGPSFSFPQPKSPDKSSEIEHADPFLRQEMLDPSRKFYHTFILQGSEQVAEYKSDFITGEMFDLNGSVPDGSMKYINLMDGSYGEDEFRNGLRHGPYQYFFKDTENLKEEGRYFLGKLAWKKEYWPDGKLRIEANYTDALNLPEATDIGEGRLYYSSGALRYEWALTIALKGGYSKAYSQDGRLMAEKKYDEMGEVTFEENYYKQWTE